MYSHRFIRSIVMIGGAQSIRIALSMLRAKVIALMLGPTGIGLLSIYDSLRETAVAGAGLGITSSGVQQIASRFGRALLRSCCPRICRYRLADPKLRSANALRHIRNPPHGTGTR